MFFRSKGQYKPKVNKFFEFLKSSIFIRLTRNLKRIYIRGHWIQPPIIFEVKINQKVNIDQKDIGRIYKILNFHLIVLKFEEDFHIRSLNSTTNFFEVNMEQKVNIRPRSTAKVAFLKSSVFIPLTWNLKRIFTSGHWIQPPIIWEAP